MCRKTHAYEGMFLCVAGACELLFHSNSQFIGVGPGVTIHSDKDHQSNDNCESVRQFLVWLADPLAVVEIPPVVPRPVGLLHCEVVRW